MFSTLDRYVLQKVLRGFLPACLGLCFLFFVGASFRLLRDENLSLEQVTMALPWVLPFLLPYLIPLAYVSTLALIFGRMVADNEVLAFGSLGIPARSLARPAILLAVFLSLICSWLTAQLVPYCHQQRKEAARAVFQQLFTLDRGEHLSRAFPNQGFDLYVRRYARERLEGIVIHYDREQGDRRLPVQIVARQGTIGADASNERLELVLEDVTATLLPGAQNGGGQDAGAPGTPIRVHLERFVQGIGLGGRRRVKALDYASPDLRQRAEQARRRGLLAAAQGGVIATLPGMDEREVEADVELAMRASMSAAPLLMTLLVIPLTLLLRARSPLIPFALGLVICSGLFFAPLLLGRSLAEASGVGAWVGLGPAVALAATAILAWWAARR